MKNLKAQAREFQENADWLRARELWEELHETAPDKADLQSWTNLARCCFNLKDLAAAGQAAQKALELKPGHVPALTLAARTATAQENWPRAAQLWRSAATAAPKPAAKTNAETGLARALIELGEFEEAAALLQRLQAAAPGKPAAWELLAKMAEKRKDTAAARIHWAAFHDRFPEEAAVSAAYLKFTGGEDAGDAARFTLEDLRRADADSAQHILSYLSARLTKGEYGETVRQLAEKFPGTAAFEANFLSARTGNISSRRELEDVLERAAAFVRNFPDHPRGWRLLAQCPCCSQ